MSGNAWSLRGKLASFAILAASLLVATSQVFGREEPIQARELPKIKVEVEPKADYGPDAPPPFYPVEEINKSSSEACATGS